MCLEKGEHHEADKVMKVSHMNSKDKELGPNWNDDLPEEKVSSRWTARSERPSSTREEGQNVAIACCHSMCQKRWEQETGLM